MAFLYKQNYDHLPVDDERMEVASIQFDAMNQTFNNILYGCLKKCIPNEYGEPELNKGEMVCIDRCVAKLHFANRLIGGFVQTKGMGPEMMQGVYDKFQEKK